ncbi:Sucrose specific transcriptional regulator CscR,LacI family [Klebsiella pneumoniae ISC21]|nr:Sucrose specific transcriptional regulator CscR,LacI family [Klebsiella pneumoniae ISC21]
MASLKDVAKLANVSLMTVSRALNTPERLKPETLARVQAAIAETKLRPRPVGEEDPRGARNPQHHRRAGAGYRDHTLFGGNHLIDRRDGPRPRLEQLCGQYVF